MDDYTIELWTIENKHFAKCSCGNWYFTSTDTEVLETWVQRHKDQHDANGDAVEVI